MFQASWNGTDKTVVQMLLAKGPAAVLAVVNRMNTLAIKLQSYIVSNKLSGQVLHHRSGKLAASVRVQPVTGDANSIHQDVNAGGGPAFYGRIHEYGGTFNRHSTAKFLTHGANGRILKHRKATLQRTMGTHVTYPERSFMRTSFAEMTPEIQAGLQQALAEAMQS